MDTGLSLNDSPVLFFTLAFIMTIFPQAPRPEPVDDELRCSGV